MNGVSLAAIWVLLFAPTVSLADPTSRLIDTPLQTPSVFPPNSCTATPDSGGFCAFRCNALNQPDQGDYAIWVYVHGTGGIVAGRADCGASNAVCVGLDTCAATFARTSQDEYGGCTLGIRPQLRSAFSGTRITCGYGPAPWAEL